MNIEKSKILLTGATGLIGGEIYNKLPNKKNVSILVRDLNESEAKKRLQIRQKGIIGNATIANDFNVIQGDVTKPGWGLKSFEYDLIIHCAAETSFLKSESCETTNIKAIEYLIELIQNSEKKPFLTYFSTASCHGIIKDKIIDEKFKTNPKQFNSYTNSKRIARKLIKDKLKDFLILRPTIVMGDNVNNKKLASSIGWALYALRYFEELPFNPEAMMDFIPVSYIGDVTMKLLQKKELQNKEFFISCGTDSCIKVKDIISTSIKVIKEKRINLNEAIVPNYKGLQKKIYDSLKFYEPFINMNIIYDNQRLVDELPEMNKVPSLLNYLPGILDQIDEEMALSEAKNP